MATDADGVTIVVGDKPWDDDGHSPDWVQETISSFTPSGAWVHGVLSAPFFRAFTLIHKNKPVDPPDR